MSYANHTLFFVLQHSAHGIALQYAVLHCNTLQHTATHCNTLQHTATHCNTAVIHCVTFIHVHVSYLSVCCSVLQGVAGCCSVLHVLRHIHSCTCVLSFSQQEPSADTNLLIKSKTATCCNTLQHTATYCKMLCNTLQHAASPKTRALGR